MALYISPYQPVDFLFDQLQFCTEVRVSDFPSLPTQVQYLAFEAHGSKSVRQELNRSSFAGLLCEELTTKGKQLLFIQGSMVINRDIPCGPWEGRQCLAKPLAPDWVKQCLFVPGWQSLCVG